MLKRAWRFALESLACLPAHTTVIRQSQRCAFALRAQAVCKPSSRANNHALDDSGQRRRCRFKCWSTAKVNLRAAGFVQRFTAQQTSHDLRWAASHSPVVYIDQVTAIHLQAAPCVQLGNSLADHQLKIRTSAKHLRGLAHGSRCTANNRNDLRETLFGVANFLRCTEQHSQVCKKCQ